MWLDTDLLLECVHAKNIWSLYNNLMTQIGKSCELVNNFEEVVKSCNSPEISIFKSENYSTANSD
jgi:hypothetical protein